MKDRPDAILRPAHARYLDDLLPGREALLTEMEEAAERQGIPVSDPEVGLLLEVLARSCQPARILEIGTAIGYGVLCLARGAPEARVLTVDNDPYHLSQAREYLARAGVLRRVEFLEGAALEVLPTLQGPFDLVYVDAAKEDYRPCLDLILPELRAGGLVVVDNLLWKGWVAEPPSEPDEDAGHIRAFNPYFMSHPQLRAVVLPLADGVGLGAKLEAGEES
jgi:caffeoyl-CoA O-methyltransferase